MRHAGLGALDPQPIGGSRRAPGSRKLIALSSSAVGTVNEPGVNCGIRASGAINAECHQLLP